MNDNVGLVSFPPRNDGLGEKPYSNETAQMIDQEVRGWGREVCLAACAWGDSHATPLPCSYETVQLNNQ